MLRQIQRRVAWADPTQHVRGAGARRRRGPGYAVPGEEAEQCPHGDLLGLSGQASLVARDQGRVPEGVPQGRDECRVPGAATGDDHLGDVEPGTVVGFNGGRTTTAVARHLAARSDLMAPGDDDAVTLVTNALNIAGEMVLRPHMRTWCIGGVARRESYELYGPYASRFLDDLHLDLLFLGVNAITATGGAMCRHYGEAGINAEMVARANRVIAVATAEKLTATVLSRICPVSAIDILVTDASADQSAVADLEAAGVEVQLA